MIAENPGPFTYLGTGVYIIGNGEVAVIDPGPPIDAHFEALKRRWPASASRTSSRRTRTWTIRRWRIRWRSGRGARSMALPDPVGARGSVSLEEDGEAGFMPDVLVNDGDVFTGPGWTLEAITTPGHMSNHVCYALKEENALFSGDHIMGWSTTVISPPDGNMGDYYRSLDEDQGARVRHAVADAWSAGAGCQRVHRCLRSAPPRARGGDRRAAEGRRHADPDMVKVIYKDVDKRLHPAAAHSVLAHMIHLVEAGRAVADGPLSAGHALQAGRLLALDHRRRPQACAGVGWPAAKLADQRHRPLRGRRRRRVPDNLRFAAPPAFACIIVLASRSNGDER